MFAAALSVGVAAVAAGCRGRDRTAAGSGAPAALPRDAGGADELGFVGGSVWIAEQRDGHVRPARLDTRTAAWVAHGGGALDLYPTELVRKGDLVAIATEGETEADHAEQLALVRGGVVSFFGPRAQAVRNPSSSRDGTVVVVEASADGFRDLYRLDLDGKVTRLTANREGNFEPAVAPDGSALAFVSSRDGQAEIYRMTPTGGDATRLTSFHKDDWSPAWASDGRMLAFLSDREGAARVFLMAPDGTGQRRLTAEADPAVVEDRPRWSLDSPALAFLRTARGRSTLVVVDPTSGAARTLTPDGFVDRDFAWGPGGTHVAVVRHPDGATGGAAGAAGAGTAGAAGAGTASGGAGAASGVMFVRVSDGAVVARAAPATPLALRWLPATAPVLGR